MSLRAFGSYLGRRFSPRGIPSTRVQAQAETLRLALHRSLRALRTLKGALVAAGGIAALTGILCSNRYGYRHNVVMTDTKIPPVDNPAIRAKFMDEDGKVAWAEYHDYINFLMLHSEVTDKKVHDEMIQRRYKPEDVKIEEQDEVDEPAMEARFEQWMKQFGRTYKNEEEKAMRYEPFKACAIRSDKVNASSARTGASTNYAPNHLADWTDEELYGPCWQKDDSYWEEYFNKISLMYAEGRIDGYPRTVGADHKVEWIDSLKQWYKILKAAKAGRDAARKAEQAAATRKSKGRC